MPPYPWHDIATKADLTRLDRNGQSIQDLRTEMVGMRTDLGGQIGQLRTEFASDRIGIASGFGQIRAEMAQMSDRSSSDLAQFSANITKQLVGLRHEIRIVLLALVGFMLSVVLAITQGGIG